MEWIALIVLVGVVLRRRSKTKTEKRDRAFSGLAAIKSWFEKKGLDAGSVTFSTYEQKELMEKGGNLVIVGWGRRFTGEDVGFLVELNHLNILVEKLFAPSGVATWHKLAAQETKAANASLYEALVYREQKFHESRQEPGADLRSQFAAAFRPLGSFEDLNSGVQEALLREAAVFHRIPRIVEMFYETVDQIAALPLSFSEKKERLIATWVARGQLFAMGEAASFEETDEDDHSEWDDEDSDIGSAFPVQTAAKTTRDFAAWQHNAVAAAKMDLEDFEATTYSEEEERRALAFHFGAVVQFGSYYELGEDQLPLYLKNFIGLFEGLKPGHQLESRVAQMLWAAQQDQQAAGAGVEAAVEFLEGGRQRQNQYALASLLGYSAASLDADEC